MRYPRKTAQERGYTKRWHRAAKLYRLENPACEKCLKVGRLAETAVVHHIVSHNGDEELFWDPSNLEARCHACHGESFVRERHGRPEPTRGCGDDGWPVDPAHPWNRGG